MTTLTWGSKIAGLTSWARLGRAALFLVALTCLALSTACGPAQTRPETVLKPLEERRARGIIEQAVLDNGSRPVKGRLVKLADGTDMTEDLALKDEVYGIAYITAREAELLGKSLPERSPDSQQLRLVRGTGGAIILLLWETDYRYDAGEQHTATAVAAERKLSRDVADFILHVVKQGKKR